MGPLFSFAGVGALGAVCLLVFVIGEQMASGSERASEDIRDLYVDWEPVRADGSMMGFASQGTLTIMPPDGSEGLYHFLTVKDFGKRRLIYLWLDGASFSRSGDVSLVMMESSGGSSGGELLFWRCPDPVPWSYFSQFTVVGIWPYLKKWGWRIGKDHQHPRCDVTADQDPPESGWVAEIWHRRFDGQR